MTQEETNSTFDINFAELSDVSNWPNSTELSNMAHKYAKQMFDRCKEKLERGNQGLFSVIYNSYIDGFVNALTYKK